MAAKPPALRYVLGVTGPVFHAGLWMMEQFLSTTVWWDWVPWWPISLCSMFLVVGMLIADFSNGNSWISEHWREWRRLFKVEGFPGYTHDVEDGKEFSRMRARLRFTRDVKQARIVVRIYGRLRQHRPQQKIFWEVAETRNWNRGEDIWIDLAKFPIASGQHQFWGDGKSHVVVESDNVIEIEVIGTGRQRQRHRMFFRSLPSQWTPGFAVAENFVGNLFDVEGA